MTRRDWEGRNGRLEDQTKASKKSRSQRGQENRVEVGRQWDDILPLKQSQSYHVSAEGSNPGERRKRMMGREERIPGVMMSLNTGEHRVEDARRRASPTADVRGHTRGHGAGAEAAGWANMVPGARRSSLPISRFLCDAPEDGAGSWSGRRHLLGRGTLGKAECLSPGAWGKGALIHCQRRHPGVKFDHV